MARVNRQKQLAFEIKTHGGRRAGSGRKKVRIGEPNHVRREKVTDRTPVHVTLKLQKSLPSLRTRSAFLRFADAVRGAEKFGLRVMHFSIQADHVHLIAEADTSREFAKGMQSLAIRFAKAIRKEIKNEHKSDIKIGIKNGIRTLSENLGVFRGRYHAHVLKTPAEVRHALEYVLQNTARHWEKAAEKAGGKAAGKVAKVLMLDPLSSLHRFEKPIELFGGKAMTSDAREYFGGDPPPLHRLTSEFLSKPKSWLLKIGWTRARA